MTCAETSTLWTDVAPIDPTSAKGFNQPAICDRLPTSLEGGVHGVDSISMEISTDGC